MWKRNIKIIGATFALAGVIVSGTNASAADSSVTVTFSSSPTSATLRPDANNERSAKIDLTATVSVTNSGGYSVYIKGNSATLNGKNSANKIPSLSAPATYGNMAANTWGYYAGEGTTMPSTATYNAISTSGSGTKILENTSKKIPSETKTIALSFATKVNSQTAADTYSNTAIVSVVSSPMTLSLSEYNNMQDITPDICDASETHETKQLTDVRDGKKYWVTKMADGNCWMSQNLDFNISASNVTTATSDVTSNWMSSDAYPPRTTETTISANGANDRLGTYSWDMGDYVITDPTASTGCTNNVGLSGCTSRFMSVGTRKPSSNPNFYRDNGNKTFNNTEYDAHYLVGTYYQWNAVTAGTGARITTEEKYAKSSICPKNWELSGKAGSYARDSFYNLLRQYGVSSNETGTGLSGNVTTAGNAYNIALDPLYFVRGGYTCPGCEYLFMYAGNTGIYYDSRAESAGGTVWALEITGSGVSAGSGYTGSGGNSVRCLVPTS